MLILSCTFTAALTNLGCFVGLLYWEPHPNQLPVFFVIPALWGMADAVWQTQTNGEYFTPHTST